MPYAPDEQRTSMARLAIFTQSQRRLRDEPPEPGVIEEPYHCLLFDLCLAKGVPPSDWSQPGKGALSVVSMRSEKLDIQFKDADPCASLVRKRELETDNRLEMVAAMMDIDGLVIIQDVGKEGEGDFEEQMIAICALIAESRGMLQGQTAISVNDFPVPVAVITLTLGGRAGNRNRQKVQELVDRAGWVYRYVSTLEHEMEIAQSLIALAAKIQKRGETNYRLVPGLVRPTPDSPLPIPVRHAEPTTVYELIDELSPSNTMDLITPQINLDGVTVIDPQPSISASSSAASDLNLAAVGGAARVSPEKKTGKKTRLPTPIPGLSLPTLSSSRSGGSLHSVASSRSLRALRSPDAIVPEAGEEFEVPPMPVPPAPAKDAITSDHKEETAAKVTDPSISAPMPIATLTRAAELSVNIATTKTKPNPRAPTPATPNPYFPNPDNEDTSIPYYPVISDVTEGDSFYNRYVQPRAAPPPPITKTKKKGKGKGGNGGKPNAKAPWFDMEGSFFDPLEQDTKKGMLGGLFGKSKSNTASGRDKGLPTSRPPIGENTFITPLPAGPSTVAPILGSTTTAGASATSAAPAAGLSPSPDITPAPATAPVAEGPSSSSSSPIQRILALPPKAANKLGIDTGLEPISSAYVHSNSPRHRRTRMGMYEGDDEVINVKGCCVVA